MGDLFISSGLLLVDSDLSTSKIKEIMLALKEKNFQSSIENIKVKIRPSFPSKFKVYDFSDKETVNKLTEKVKSYYNHKAADETVTQIETGSDQVYSRLLKVIERAKPDTLKSPQKVISKLEVFFDQRAWLQIQEKDKRKHIRTAFVDMLSKAYECKKDTASANKIRKIAQAEENLHNPNKNQPQINTSNTH